MVTDFKIQLSYRLYENDSISNKVRVWRTSPVISLAFKFSLSQLMWVNSQNGIEFFNLCVCAFVHLNTCADNILTSIDAFQRKIEPRFHSKYLPIL